MNKILRLFKKKPRVVDFWDCSRLNLVDLPKEVLQHRHTIVSLYMQTNSIKDIPKGLFLFELLSELDLSENEILFLSPSVSKLQTLTVLNLSKNSITTLPPAIGDLPELIRLDLSSNPISILCDEITNLRQLRELIINDSTLEDLPPNIGKLSKLEVLEVRENLLQTLPASLSHLTLLEKLDLGNNEFIALSNVIGSLESLSELWLDTNTISSLPDEFGNLHNLKFLELSENHLMVLPITIGGLVNLNDLYLNENLLSMLPESFGELPSLRLLRLDHNRLGGLPDNLQGWASLMELNLSHNHLTELPPSIGCVTTLKNMNLDENMLTSLPAEISNCTSLQLLSIRNNQLFEIPPEFCSLENLTILNLIGNRLHHLPYTLTSLKNLSAIWIAENQSRPIVDLQLESDQRGERWLTCFLLPQQGEEPPYDEASSPLPLDAAVDEDAAHQFPLRKSSMVNFDPQVQDRKSKLNRDPTPFPKELHTKAMQWRASRDYVLKKSGEEGQTGLDEVALKHTHRRMPNRYSLLKAFADPLDDHENLISFKRRGGSTSSHPTSPSPHVPTIPEQVEPVHTILSAGQTSQASNVPGPKSPSSGSGGYSTKQQQQELLEYPSSPTGKTSLTSSGVASPPPLPPITDSYLYSPEGSTVQSVQSGPYLDPPDEFSATPKAQLSSMTPSPKPQPSQNGRPDIKHHQVNLHAAMSDPQVHESSSLTGTTDTREALDHIVLMANTNGNSNNNNNYRLYPVSASRGYNSVSTGIGNRAPIGIGMGMGLRESHFPSEASTLSHSDNPEIRSSLESGFDADNELENSPAWYVSPETSPKTRRNLHQQRKLGPKVVLSKDTYNPYTSTHQVPTKQQQQQQHGSRGGSGGSLKSREKSITEEFEQNPLLHGRRRGSDDVVQASYSTTQQQSARRLAYKHQVSRSFDAAEMIVGGSGDIRAGIFGSGVASHSRTPGAPMSPVVQEVRDSKMKTRMVPVRGGSGGGGNQGGVVPSISHVRSKSQPEEMLNVVSMLAPPQQQQLQQHQPQMYSHTHSHSQPYATHFSSSQGSSQSPRVRAISPHISHPSHHHHHHHRHHNEKSLLYQQRKLVMSDESIFQSAYPGHRGSHNPKGQSTSRGQSSSGGSFTGKVHEHSQLHTNSSYHHSPLLKTPHSLESYYVSDDSQPSGHPTPDTTPILGGAKGKWVSGNDSGFDSMKRSHQPPLGHTGTYIEVDLVKEPTLGLGITGGRDGENAIKAGDKGFHIYKVVEGLPAEKCGKIAIGDRLLEVNGVEVSSLTSQEVLALLTGLDNSVTLLLHREPSVTLL